MAKLALIVVVVSAWLVATVPSGYCDVPLEQGGKSEVFRVRLHSLPNTENQLFQKMRESASGEKYKIIYEPSTYIPLPYFPEELRNLSSEEIDKKMRELASGEKGKIIYETQQQSTLSPEAMKSSGDKTQQQSTLSPEAMKLSGDKTQQQSIHTPLPYLSNDPLEILREKFGAEERISRIRYNKNLSKDGTDIRLFKRQSSDQSGGFLSGLSNLAQQAQSMAQAQQLISSILQPKTNNQTPLEATAKSAYDNSQITGASALSGASQTAQTAQTGVGSALTELSQGLQRLTLNNPNLVPDIKTLYKRVSSSMSGTSSSASNQFGGQSAGSNIVPANNQDELADNLAKVAVPGLQVGQPPQPGIYPNLFQNSFLPQPQ